VESRVRELKVRYNAELLKRHYCDLKNSVFLTDEQYYKLIKDVNSAKSKTTKKEPRDLIGYLKNMMFWSLIIIEEVNHEK